jgi:hypothetical protein
MSVTAIDRGRHERVYLVEPRDRRLADGVDERLAEAQRRSGRALAFTGTARLRSFAHRYGVYRYFLIAGLFTFARVMIAEPVP